MMQSTKASIRITEDPDNLDCLAETTRIVTQEAANLLAETRQSTIGRRIQRMFLSHGNTTPGMITFLCGKSLGAPTRQIARVAASVQFSYMASLIHKRIVDSFDTQVQMSRKDINDCLILGDAFAAFALMGLAAAGQKAVRTISQAGLTLCDAAYDESSLKGSGVRVSIYEAMVKKYASFYGAAALTGALIAKSSGAEVIAFSRFGQLVGTARKITLDMAANKGIFRSGPNRSYLVARYTSIVKSQADKAKTSIRMIQRSLYSRQLEAIAESVKPRSGTHYNPKSFIEGCTQSSNHNAAVFDQHHSRRSGFRHVW